MVRVSRVLIGCGLAMLMACGGDDGPPTDARIDGATLDAAIDAAIIDAAIDAAIIDAAIDAAIIDATDAPPVDAAVDAPPVDAAIDGVIAPIDASLIDAAIDAGMSTTCDPLAAPGLSGCATGLKCTWLTITDTPSVIGMIGCVPDGTVANGGACVRGIAGPTTGFDDCGAGLICASGTCHDVCGLDPGPGAACAAGQACTRYSGLFANTGDTAPYGACNPSCDPLTQLEADGTPCPTGQGCYLLTSSTTTIAVCASAGAVGHNQPITGSVFANSCLPGHQPRRPAPNATTYECGALCRPADVYLGNNEAAEGGVAPYTCVAKGAAPPANPTAGESCRYYWAREPFSTPSPFSNTTGFCWKHAIWTYDSNLDNVLDAPFPRCPTLTTGDVVPPIGMPPHSDALYFWCVQEASTFAKALVPVVRMRFAHSHLDRLAP